MNEYARPVIYQTMQQSLFSVERYKFIFRLTISHFYIFTSIYTLCRDNGQEFLVTRPRESHRGFSIIQLSNPISFFPDLDNRVIHEERTVIVRHLYNQNLKKKKKNVNSILYRRQMIVIKIYHMQWTVAKIPFIRTTPADP